jgi:hypothetical protein
MCLQSSLATARVEQALSVELRLRNPHLHRSRLVLRLCPTPVDNDVDASLRCCPEARAWLPAYEPTHGKCWLATTLVKCVKKVSRQTPSANLGLPYPVHCVLPLACASREVSNQASGSRSLVCHNGHPANAEPNALVRRSASSSCPADRWLFFPTFHQFFTCVYISYTHSAENLVQYF